MRGMRLRAAAPLLPRLAGPAPGRQVGGVRGVRRAGAPGRPDRGRGRADARSGPGRSGGRCSPRCTSTTATLIRDAARAVPQSATRLLMPGERALLGRTTWCGRSGCGRGWPARSRDILEQVDALIFPGPVRAGHAVPGRPDPDRADAGRPRATPTSGTWSGCRPAWCRAASARTGCRSRSRSSAGRSTTRRCCGSPGPTSARRPGTPGGPTRPAGSSRPSVAPHSPILNRCQINRDEGAQVRSYSA